MQQIPVKPAQKPATAAVAGGTAKPTLALMPTKLTQSDTRSLVIHGAPKTGKTSLINALVSAGIEVYHIDMDFNNLSLLCGDAPNYHWCPVRNSLTNNTWKFYKQLRERNRVTVCHEHGTVDCPQCKAAGLPFYELDLLALPKRAIVVHDSFTSYYRSVTDAVVAENSKDNLKVEDSDTPFFRTLSSAAVPVWHMMLKMPGAADSLVLTHQKDKQNMMNSNPKSPTFVPSYKYPLSGSGAHSLDINSLSPASAVWATFDEPVADKRRFVTKATTKVYAFSPEEFGNFADLTPPQAIVEFFKRNRV